MMRLEMSPYHPHCFFPLTYLYINKGEEYNTYFFSSNNGLELLVIYFTIFTDQENWFEFSDHKLGWLETENMPPCLTQHVTKIKMEAFTNGKSDL